MLDCLKRILFYECSYYSRTNDILKHYAIFLPVLPFVIVCLLRLFIIFNIFQIPVSFLRRTLSSYSCPFYPLPLYMSLFSLWKMGVLEHFSGLNATLTNFTESSQIAQLASTSSAPSLKITLVIGLVLYFSIAYFTQPKLVTNAQYVGYRSMFEPTWLLRLRWSWDARRILKEGYYKVFTT
jgi:hypothetical protein